jgi:hypothetical protein
MAWTDDLAKYLRVHINEKFRDPDHPMNVNYHEAKGETYITLDKVDYHFEFREVNGNVRFFMGIKPSEQGTLDELVARAKLELPSNNELDRTSRDFKQYSIEQNGESIIFSCGLKRFPKTQKEGDEFRKRLWSEFVQKLMKVARDIYSSGKS